MIDFGQLFSRAWELCWRQRWLFLLGILAVLGGRSFGPQFNFSFRGGDFGPQFEAELEAFIESLVERWPSLIAIGMGLFLLAILFWLLRLTAAGGLIAAANELDEGQPATLGTSWRRGLRRLPALVGLDVVLYGPLLLIIFLPILIIFLTIGSSILVLLRNPNLDGPPPGIGGGFLLGFSCLCVMACVAIFWRVFLAFLYPLAQRAIVLGNQGVLGAIRSGWALLRQHPGDVLLLVIFFFVIGIVYGALLNAIFIPVGLALSVPTFLDLIQGGPPDPSRLAMLGVISALLSLLGQLLFGLLFSYKSVAYTLAYRQLTDKVERVEKTPTIPDAPYTFAEE